MGYSEPLIARPPLQLLLLLVHIACLKEVEQRRRKQRGFETIIGPSHSDANALGLMSAKPL